MRILGLAAETHDAGVALLENGAPVMVIEEERLNRQKKTSGFPRQSLSAVLEDCDLDITDIDVITMPWHASRLARTFAGIILRGLPRSLHLFHEDSRMSQRNGLLMGTPYMRRRIRRYLRTRTLPPLQAVGHHDSHAAAYFVSPFDEATVLVMDGYGDDAATSVYTGVGDRLTRQWHTSLLNSLGIVYTAVTQYLGFRPNQDEGKVMGLSAYGESTYVKAFRKIIGCTPDGRYQVDYSYFWYPCYGLRRSLKPKFYHIFGPARNEWDGEISQRHKDIAFALQAVTEEVILHVVRQLTKDYPSRNLCLLGGVALNCVANALILQETDVERIWIPPNASDTGAAFGSALWHHHVTLNQPRNFRLKHAFYGQGYSDETMVAALESLGMPFEKLDENTLLDRVAHDLADGKIVGWFQGRFEMGPRALGNRSILADPRRAEMKDIVNRRVKYRESFRPFAPAVLEEKVGEIFHIDQVDPYMTIAPKVRAEKAHLIPAVVHEDQTCRIQTIARAANPRYYGLIEKFGEITGVPVLLNSSFNRQEPIVSRPQEAVSCFLRTDMDVLVLGNHYSTDRNPDAIKKVKEAFGD